jgi:hypothetical protein
MDISIVRLDNITAEDFKKGISSGKTAWGLHLFVVCVSFCTRTASKNVVIGKVSFERVYDTCVFHQYRCVTKDYKLLIIKFTDLQGEHNVTL